MHRSATQPAARDCAPASGFPPIMTSPGGKARIARRIDVGTGAVVGDAAQWSHECAVVRQRGRPVRGRVELLAAGRVAREQARMRRVRGSRRVAEEVVHVCGARVTGMHDRIVGGGVAPTALDDELRHPALRTEPGRGRARRAAVARRRDADRRNGRDGRDAERDRAGEDGGEGAGPPHAHQAPGGRVGSAIASVSTGSGPSDAGRTGAVSASGMLGCGPTSGSGAVS